jgi:hypothetical protein
MLLLQTAIQCFFAAIIYHFIVQQRRTTAAYLLGWGLILPLVLYFPYVLLEVLDIQNMVIKMASGTTTFIIGFRTAEAMYDTSPHTVETSVGTYMVYYTTLLHFEWDENTKKRRAVTGKELRRIGQNVIVFALVLSCVLSFEMHHNFEPWSSPVKLEEFHFNTDLLSVAHLLNAYCLAVLTYLTLLFAFELTSFGDQAKGYYTKPVFSNPLFTSRSPSEFWGRKWNMMIHNILKYGAYLPARQYVSKEMAVVWTFRVSGLVHDYVWSLLFYQHEHTKNEDGVCLDCFVPTVLKLTAFFFWNGTVMLLERPIGKYLSPITKHIPTPILSTLVVLTALPVSHWYTGDWAKGGYFKDLSIGLWQIRQIQIQ